MKLLTKESGYAARVLVRLARSRKEYVPVSVLAGMENIPYPFMRKIIYILMRNGYIVSKAGKDGGVKLGKNPSRINMAELLEVFQGKINVCPCVIEGNICRENRTCPLKSKMHMIERNLNRELRRITLSQFI